MTSKEARGLGVDVKATARDGIEVPVAEITSARILKCLQNKASKIAREIERISRMGQEYA